MTRFERYQLRTTDVDAARRFYAALLGGSDRLAARELDVTPLPAAVAARKVPSHWLGHIGVEDIEAAAAAFVELGAERLGPTMRDADGRRVQILRDMGGAVVALTDTDSAMPTSTTVIWHGLNTAELERSRDAYARLFGWHVDDRAQAQVDLGEAGVFVPFSWTPGGPAIGSLASIAGRPNVHPHWLFQLRVDDLDRALATVREAGGIVVGTIALPNGARIGVCDDPQGAAIALREPARLE